MKLLELIKAVQEKNLTKQQLEDYHLELTGMYATLMWELAEKEKAEAVYFLAAKDFEVENGRTPPADIAIKRLWRASPAGQRLIELKNYEKATTKVLASLKSRMYSQY